MSAPLLPSPLDYVGLRRFALYPPVALPDPNEWILGVGARSEVQVVNAATGKEMWISRQYIGAVSETHSGALVVGLTQGLQFREGSAEPKYRQVIEMPVVTDSPTSPLLEESKSPSGPAPVVAIRLEPKPKFTASRALQSACTGAIVLALLAALVTAAIHF